MDNLTSFIVYFGAYLTVYLLIIALVVVAVLIGIRLRKNKTAAMEAASDPEKPEKEPAEGNAA